MSGDNAEDREAFLKKEIMKVVDYLLACGANVLTQEDFDAWLARRPGLWMNKPPYFLLYRDCHFFIWPSAINKHSNDFHIHIHWKGRRTQDCIVGIHLKTVADFDKWVLRKREYFPDLYDDRKLLLQFYRG